MSRSNLTLTLSCSLAVGLCALACNNDPSNDSTTTFETGITNSASNTLGDGDGDNETSDSSMTMGCPPGGCLDMSNDTEGEGCSAGDSECNKVDLLFIIDNSGTMGEEQVNLSANFPLLIDQLQMLQDDEGQLLNPDVHIMVTTTDLGHPNCTPFEPPGYDPARGAPQTVPCNQRLDDFTGLGSNPPSFPEACNCPNGLAPVGAPYIAFSGPGGTTTNVPGNDVKGTLSCIGPQGINGCGFESPLEAMLQATYTGAAWNTAPDGFLREEAILAIAIITDEADCSVRSPDGYAYFTSDTTYWELDPNTGMTNQATSAVCWNAGVDCGAPDGNGVYADCNSVDVGVLQPLTRYLNYLQGELIGNQNKEVIMLGILGVPEVTAHNPNPPYQPIAGGVMELVYRDWIAGAYPGGDILPGDTDTAADKQYQFGIGPGCTGEDGMGGFTGQAIPPVRIKEVCESLNEADKIRCCIESVCDTDFSGAIGCLAGILQTVFVPIG